MQLYCWSICSTRDTEQWLNACGERSWKYYPMNSVYSISCPEIWNVCAAFTSLLSSKKSHACSAPCTEYLPMYVQFYQTEILRAWIHSTPLDWGYHRTSNLRSQEEQPTHRSSFAGFRWSWQCTRHLHYGWHLPWATPPPLGDRHPDPAASGCWAPM